MIRQLLVLTLVFLSILQVGAQSAQKEIPTIGINQLAQGKLYKVDGYKSYHLINVNSIEKKYLFFSLKTEAVYQGFNLSLTIYKQGTQTPLVRCIKQEVDSCYLAKEQVFLNQSLFVVVECESGEQLEYKLRTYWSDLEHLIVGTETRFMFSEKQQKQIYHLELEGMEFKELRIIIRPETRRYPFDKIKMYGTFGAKSNPSATVYDFKSFPLWEDAEGIYLYRGELKDLTMNLILYGETKTVYSMRCEIVNKTHGDLGINQKIYEYMQKQQTYTYHLKFKDQKSTYFYENYVFRFAVFTGELDVKFYKDQHKTQKVEDLVSYAYMGDMQYAFSNKTLLQQKMPNGLFIEVESTKRVSTYMLEFQGRGKSQSLQLHEHIYQFLPIQKTQLAYMKVGKFIDKKTESKFRLVFTDVPVMGRVAIEFRVCKKDLNQCMGVNYTQHSDRILAEVKQVGSKVTYTLQLAQSMFSSVNIVEQNALIVVVMTNMLPQGQSFSAVEYNVGNRPEFLRQNKPIQSYVRKSEIKMYKYVCQDPSIKKVRIHINKINGCFDTFALRRLPSQEELMIPTHGKVTGSIIEFSQKLLQDPIVLVISGIDSATYSIVLQTINRQEQQLSYITLSEDVEFKMKIASNKYEIFEVVPISSSIYFDYKATGPVHVCLLNEDMMCIQKNIPVLENQGKVNIQTFYNRKAYIKVRNPLNRVVEVKSIFHSRKQEHCELIKMGHLAQQILTEGKCLYTVLDQPKDFQVMVVHDEYGEFSYKTVICSQLVNIPRKKFDQQRFFISKDLLQRNCQGNAEYTFTFVVVGNLSRMADGRAQAAEKLHAKYIIQYVDSIVVIPDGVGYHGTEITTEQAIKKFSYSLINKANTSIMVTTRSKLIFLVKVVQSSERAGAIINFNNYHFTSPSDKFYFLDSIHLTIPAQQLTKWSCTQCQLLIYLYSQQTIGQIVDYTIQVTQNFEVLEEGVQRKSYLTQNSKAFYSYNVKQEGQVLIELSDNNQNCAQLYVSRTEYPDQNNHDKKSFDGEIIYENKKKEPSTIYISVKARVNCAYSVGASLLKGSVKIKKLERGVLSPLTLKNGQVRYFTFKHVSQSPFKILSLHKYGNIHFYLNKTSPEEVGEILKQGQLNYESFAYKSQQKNRLTLSPSNVYFCKGCFYVIAAVASKPTDSSLFLADEQTKIPISQDKVINDILPDKGSFTKGEFYPLQNGVIQVKVHSGKLSVEVKYKDQTISNTFEKQNTKQTFNFSLKYVSGFYGTATATFKAQAPNTVYSLRIYSQRQKTKQLATKTQTIVNPSEPNYFYVDGVKETVLKGYLKSREDKIFISFFLSDKQLLRFMNLTATLDGKPADISRDTTRNVLSIGFIDAPKLSYQKGVPYQLIFSLQNQTMSMIAMQTQQTSLLPQNLEVLVTGVQTYDIYPEGQFLLDIFECRGSASLSYSKTRAGLQKQKQKVLDVVGMPDQPHAVKIQQGYTNMLLRITSSLSLVRWLPINRQEQRGLGYYLYKAGTLKYDSVFGNIDFTVQPLSRTSQKTKTKISEIKYNLYISSSQQDLKQASLCERYLSGSVLEYRSIHQQIFTSSFKFSIDKNKLSERYKLSQNLFAVIVADLTLNIPDGSQEYYRFVYNQQEIAKQIFTPSKLQTFHFVSLSVFLALLIIALFVLAWLCTKVFVPMIGRLRNRMLVQEQGLQTSKDKDIEIKDDHLEPPPSSDRQNIIKDDAPPTQEAMS